MRRVIPVLAVVLLVAGVWFFWPDDADSPTTTMPEASGSTTSLTTPPAPTTTTLGSATTTDGSHVVQTVEEAEAILRELWFGWFEGIYNQDEDRIREVVASEHQAQLGFSQFGVMQFTAAPRPDDIRLSDTEILLNSDACTVILTTTTLSGFGNAQTTDVHVLRWDKDWRFFSLWKFRDDLWESDCDALLG